MSVTTAGPLGRLVMTVCLLLGLATWLPGCSQEIPVLVSIHGAGIESAKFTLTPTLAEVQRSAIELANPSAEVVIYLPATASGKLRLAAHGEDSDGCSFDGSTEVDIAPVHNGALGARIEIDPQRYPECKLTVTVRGRGSVRSSDSAIHCAGQEGMDTSCENHLHKGTNLTLEGMEDSLDIGQDGWQVDCAVATELCALVVNRQMTVRTSFSKRVCGANGSCTADGTNKDDSGRRVSSNGLWAVGSNDTLFNWDNAKTRWNFVAKLPDQTKALWASEKVAWVISHNIIWQCTAAGCAPQQEIDFPRTLYAFGGDDSATPSFWVTNKLKIYRCIYNGPGCKQTAISDLILDVAHASPRILNIIADTGNEAIVSGYYPEADASCKAFVRHCNGNTCEKTITTSLKSCWEPAAFRFREQIGHQLTLWVYLKDEPAELFRFPSRSFIHPSTAKRIPIRASIGSNVPANVWIVGDAGNILLCNNHNCSGNQPNSPTSNNLNAIWIDQNNGAWIAGDNGTVISCSQSGMPCNLHTLPLDTFAGALPNLDVIHSDLMGAWALSQNGTRIRCDNNQLVPCKAQASVP